MNILITGTTGFVGGYFKSALQQDGHHISEVNRNRNIKGSITFDRSDLDNCRSSVWIHLAGMSKDVENKKMLPSYLEANVEITRE